ncbi:MAG: outer membrane protein assembly factor BamA [Brevinema sp.]
MKRKIYILLIILFSPLIHAQNLSQVVSEVRFQGLKATSTNDALNTVQLRPGEVFTPAKINYALKDLYAMKRFKTVQVDIANTQEGAVITFIVEEESLIDKIVFEGVSRFQAGKLKKEIDLKEGMAFREASVRAAVFALKQYYTKEGNLEAEVSYRLEPIKQLPGQYDLIFEISTGSKIVIQDIIFKGNNSFKSKKLSSLMKSKPKLWIFRSGVLKEEEFAIDKEILLAFYQQNGYMDAAITNFTWNVEDIVSTNKQGEITKTVRGIVLRIDISEGEQYKVGTFQFQNNQISSGEELRKFITLKEGEIYNKTVVEQTRANIYKSYADRGYLLANITVLEEKGIDNVIDTTFVIFEGARAHIENVSIRGNTKTLPSVIRRYIQVKEGELYVNKKLEQSFNRLMQTQYFSDVRIEPSAGSADGLINVDFVVTEQQTGMIEFLVGYGTVSGFSAGIKLSERNLLGRGYQISIRADWGQYRQLGEITFTEPAILNSPFSISFIVGVFNNIYIDIPTDENRDGIIDGTDFDYIQYPDNVLNRFESDYQYTRLSFRVGLAIGVQFAVYWNANLGYEINVFRDYKANFTSPVRFDGTWEIDDTLIDSLAFGWTIQSSIYTTLRFNNTDGGLWPTTGFNSALFLSFSGGILGGDIHFINLTYSLDYYWNPFWDLTFAFHYDMSFLFPQIGQQFSYRDANLLNFDGVYKMRGWLNYLAKGEALSYFSIEMRIPIWQFIGTVMFWDYGAVFTNFNEFSWRQPNYIMSFGIGAAINLPVLPIRLYAARPVEWQNGAFRLANNPSFWKGWEFVFSIQGLF